ncbi:YceI family protein [Flavobacterium sp.]|uniref:YceI family protein n=1 Tax=Flavobacterium sp. TaxID=239 RepID=UPI0025BCE637|nr:YceI family protein [Flavobacterium sp.]MBA4153781.1 hypothetical protein [Flavobacterium sp.]
MKKITTVVALCFLIGTSAYAQKKMTRTGEVKFEASMPSFEEIAANTKTASCILDETNGDFVALILVKSFKFKAPLMEEHFNENYMESSKFPKATFKGKIINFDKSKLNGPKTPYELEGELTIHGVTKKIKTKINLELKEGKYNVTAAFIVKAEDYKIEIPNLVKEKIAKDIDIALLFTLE